MPVALNQASLQRRFNMRQIMCGGDMCDRKDPMQFDPSSDLSQASLSQHKVHKL